MLDYNYAQYANITWQSGVSLFGETLLKRLPVSLHELDDAIGEHIIYTRMTCQLDGHPMSLAELSVSIPSVVNHCRFQQGTCEN